MNNPWLLGLVAYCAGSSFLLLFVYTLIPVVARRLVGYVVRMTCSAVQGEVAKRREALLERGQEIALGGPQAMIIGHLVEPHLRKFAGWISQQWSSQTVDGVGQGDAQYVESCLKLLEPRRWPLALAISQGMMLLIAFGFIVRGVIS